MEPAHSSCLRRLEVPRDPSPIWRYMSFANFMSMLENGGLYFCPPSNFRDPFECYIGRKEIERQCVEAGIKGAPTEADEINARITHRLMINNLFISSWHLSHAESAAMWNEYSDQADGLALCSTVADLWTQVAPAGDAGVYKIEYVDYEDPKRPALSLIESPFYKRLAFQHEKEIRAVIWSFAGWESSQRELAEARRDGKRDLRDFNRPRRRIHWHRVDLQALVNNILIAPTAEPWFRQLVERVLARYDLQIPVHQSSLLSNPMFEFF